MITLTSPLLLFNVHVSSNRSDPISCPIPRPSSMVTNDPFMPASRNSNIEQRLELKWVKVSPEPQIRLATTAVGRHKLTLPTDRDAPRRNLLEVAYLYVEFLCGSTSKSPFSETCNSPYFERLQCGIYSSSAGLVGNPPSQRYDVPSACHDNWLIDEKLLFNERPNCHKRI